MDMLKEEKKRVFLIVVLIILIIVYTFELISLGILKKNEGKRLDEDIVDKETYYTISFDEDNGNEIKEEKQKANEKIKLYTPSKEGYVFLGWLLNNRLISDNYIVTSDIELKAKWLKENEVYIIENIPEYDDSEAQDKIPALNNIQSYRGNIKYKDENVNIEIADISSLGDKSSDCYIKVNDKIIYDNPNVSYSVSLFTFNGNYIVHLTSLGTQCYYTKSFIINENGELLGKITDNVYPNEPLTSNIITYYKETNIIKDSYFRAYIDRSDSPYKVVTYKIEDNQLKIINSIIPKEDTYYIYDEFGNYKTLSNENSGLERVEIDNKIYYFAEKEDTNANTIEIYDNNLNKVKTITGLSENCNYIINTNNTITFYAKKDGMFVVFDSNMNLIHESKNHEIVGIVSDYVIVIKDKKARILDLEENEVAVFDELPDNYESSNKKSRDPGCVYFKNNEITFYITDNSTDNYWTYKYNLETKERSINKED